MGLNQLFNKLLPSTGEDPCPGSHKDYSQWKHKTPSGGTVVTGFRELKGFTKSRVELKPLVWGECGRDDADPTTQGAFPLTLGGGRETGDRCGGAPCLPAKDKMDQTQLSWDWRGQGTAARRSQEHHQGFFQPDSFPSSQQ